MQNSSASGGGAGPPQQWSSTLGNPNERGTKRNRYCTVHVYFYIDGFET